MTLIMSCRHSCQLWLVKNPREPRLKLMTCTAAARLLKLMPRLLPGSNRMWHILALWGMQQHYIMSMYNAACMR